MSPKKCDRCGRTIDPGDAAYHFWLWVVARVNEDLSSSSSSDLEQAVSDVSKRFASLPERVLASEIYARRAYLVCLWCKEHILANPLDKEWS